MPKRYRWRYTVTGTYEFPIDMLRYDRAFPDTETDSGKVMNLRWSRSLEPVSIRVIGLSDPTVGRWESFGWKVSDVLREDYW